MRRGSDGSARGVRGERARRCEVGIERAYPSRAVFHEIVYGSSGPAACVAGAAMERRTAVKRAVRILALAGTDRGWWCGKGAVVKVVLVLFAVVLLVLLVVVLVLGLSAVAWGLELCFAGRVFDSRSQHRPRPTPRPTGRRRTTLSVCCY